MPIDPSRQFSYIDQHRVRDQFTVEARWHSKFDGAINFLVGANWLDRETGYELFRSDNILTAHALGGSSGFPLALLPGVFGLELNQHLYKTKSVFGELYWEFADAFKLTLGLRYNDDKQSIKDITHSFTSADLSEGVDGPVARLSLPSIAFGATPYPEQLAIMDFHGVTDAVLMSTTPGERLAALQRIPVAEQPNETRLLNSTPDHGRWEQTSFRMGLGWQPNERFHYYAMIARGSKPGGFHRFGRAIFDEEVVDTIELGVKGTFMQDTMRINAAVFHNDQKGLQIEAFDQASLLFTRNFDASSWGLELEVDWQPNFLPNLDISVTGNWLDTEVDDANAADVSDPTFGDSNYIVLRDMSQTFAVRRDDLQPWIAPALAGGFANSNPATFYPDGTPSLFNAGYLRSVGLETALVEHNLAGNDIPYSPEYSIALSVGYVWYFENGSLYANWSYYRQAKSYTRVHNRPLDRIEAWDQQNASIEWRTFNNQWSVRLWVRNFEKEQNVNAHSTTSGTLGGGRNLLLNEPRIFGLTIGFDFGAEA